MTKEVPDGEELFDLINGKYKQALELINHLLDVGEDIFDISYGREFREKRKYVDYTTKTEKEFYKALSEARSKLYLTRERVIKAKIKRARSTFGKWSMVMRNKYEGDE